MAQNFADDFETPMGDFDLSKGMDSNAGPISDASPIPSGEFLFGQKTGLAPAVVSMLQSSPEISLESRWQTIFSQCHKPEAVLHLIDEGRVSLREVYRIRLQQLGGQSEQWGQLAGLSDHNGILNFLVGETPAAVAGFFGAKSRVEESVGPENGNVDFRTEIAVADALLKHTIDPEENPLPAQIRVGLPAAITGVVAAFADVSMHGRNGMPSNSNDLLFRLCSETERFRSLSVDFALRTAARRTTPDSILTLAKASPKKIGSLCRNHPDAINRECMQWVARQVAQRPGLPSTYEAYLLSHAMGGGTQSNIGQHLTLSGGSIFREFPELEGPEMMDRGLKLPHKVTLPEGVRLFNPAFINSDLFFAAKQRSLDPAEAKTELVKSSLIGMVFGLTRDTSRILQQVVLGEAAVIDMDDKKAGLIFEQEFQPALKDGASLDRGFGSSSPIANLIAQHVHLPKLRAGLAVDALHDDLEELKRQEKIKTSATGPRGVELLLKAMGADRPTLAMELGLHWGLMRKAKGVDGLRAPQLGFGEQIAVSEERMAVLRSFYSRPLLDVVTINEVPILRTPGLRPNEVLEEDADALYKMQRNMAMMARDLKKNYSDPKSIPDSELARLQTIWGYQLLGEKAYERLPMARSMRPEEKLGVGILGALEGKHGIIRETLFGTRYTQSARLVALPNDQIPVDAVQWPPQTMATIRGDYLLAALPKPPQSDDQKMSLEEWARLTIIRSVLQIYSKQTKHSDLLEDLRTGMGSLLKKQEAVEPQFGVALRKALEDVIGKMPEPQRAEGRRLLLDERDAPGAFAGSKLNQYLAHQILSEPDVKEHLGWVNKNFQAMVLRYPTIHHHSFLALYPVLGSPDSVTMQIHPLVAGGLNADWDGDQIDTWAPLPYGMSPDQSKVWKLMMDSHSPLRAFLSSGSGTDLLFKLNLNASEGLVKSNLCYLPPEGLPKDANLLNADLLRSHLQNALGGRDELLVACIGNPNTFLEKQGVFLQAVRALTGDVSIDMNRWVVAGDAKGATTLSRFFLHEMVEMIAGPEATAKALGPKFVGPGDVVKTSGKDLEQVLLTHCLPSADKMQSKEPGDYLGSLYGAFYTYLSSAAVTSAHSIGEKTPLISESLEWIARQPLVQEMRDRYETRMTAIEIAASKGLLTAAQQKTLTMRLESGEKKIEEKDYTKDGNKVKGLDSLLAAYRSAKIGEDGKAREDIENFLKERIENPAYGLKPLAKASLRFACEVYAKEFGHPNLLIEQVLTDKVKASDEVLYRFFMGTANLIGGEIVPTTYGGLVGKPTVDRILKSSPAAQDKATESKTAIQDPGAAFKDYERAISGVFVSTQTGAAPGVDPWKNRARSFALKDYSESDATLDYLVHQTKLRTLRFEPASIPDAEKRTAWEQKFRLLNESIPYSSQAVVNLLKEVVATYPDAKLQIRSVLFDRMAGIGVAADSVGYLPTGGPEGLKVMNGKIVRRPLSEGRWLGVPIGAMMSGGLGELVSQAVLRTRHITGSSVAEYSHYGDWLRVANGPNPQKEPFYRKGGDRVRSANPLACEGLENCGTAMRAKVDGIADAPLRTANRIELVGGIEVFPGEQFYVRSGVLHIGTDRPQQWSVPIGAIAQDLRNGHVPNELKDALNLVVPDRFQVRLSIDEAKQLGMKVQDSVVNTDRVEIGGKNVPALHLVTTVSLGINVSSAQQVLDALKRDLGIEDIASRISVSNDAKYKIVDMGRWSSLNGYGLGYYQVSEEKGPINLPGSTPVMGGSILNPRTGLAHTNLETQLNRGLDGFEVVLAQITGKEIGVRAPLSYYSGTVVGTELVNTKHDGCMYEVCIETKPGKREVQHLMVDKNTPLFVFPGQTVERGQPLTFGAVDLAERSRLRPETAMVEFSDYLTGYFYQANGRSPLPLATELVAKAVFPNGEYTPIPHMGLHHEYSMGAQDPFLSLGRSGKISSGIPAAFDAQLSSGFGRTVSVLTLEQLQKIGEIAAPGHLFPTPHPSTQIHTSKMAEHLQAAGIKSSLAEPLHRAAQSSRADTRQSVGLEM